jgi:two-component system response regulator PilR (NtrC family)
LVASALHNLSPRKTRNFVTINCTTFPEGLLESEMFGHMKGSFTGAICSKSGLFEIADGGSFFLDEIGDMPLSLQSKLLRVLENGTFRRVGGTSDVKVDARIIAATNKNIPEEVSAGRFREDLYYRLNVVPVTIPPLRERTEDIPLLLDHFLAKYSSKPIRFSPDTLHILMSYPWKGNVRELENISERMVLLCDREIITPEDLPDEIAKFPYRASVLPEFGNGDFDLERTMENIEKAYLLKALEITKGVKTEAAKGLNISCRSFRHRLNKYGIR